MASSMSFKERTLRFGAPEPEVHSHVKSMRAD